MKKSMAAMEFISIAIRRSIATIMSISNPFISEPTMAKTEQPYFENKWMEIASTPSDHFITPFVTQVMENVGSWEVDESWMIVRTQDDNLKTSEHHFMSKAEAEAFCEESVADGLSVVCYDNESMGTFNYAMTADG